MGRRERERKREWRGKYVVKVVMDDSEIVMTVALIGH